MDDPLLDRLTQRIEQMGWEFGQFVEEEDTVVGEGEFSGNGDA
jgi:hypothetical protein